MARSKTKTYSGQSSVSTKRGPLASSGLALASTRGGLLLRRRLYIWPSQIALPKRLHLSTPLQKGLQVAFRFDLAIFRDDSVAQVKSRSGPDLTV